jgi:hypothetical protein
MKIRHLKGVGLSHSEQGSAAHVTRVSDINYGPTVLTRTNDKTKIIRIPVLISFFVEFHGQTKVTVGCES